VARRFGYKEEWLTTGEIEAPGRMPAARGIAAGVTLALVAVAIANEGDRRLMYFGDHSWTASSSPPSYRPRRHASGS